jgi:paraquat-inducible protein A
MSLAGTAAGAGLMSCHDCGQLSRLIALPAGHVAHCPRCDAPLHGRRSNSIARTWALLIAAYILYIPANVLPVSTVIWMGQGQPDTIMSGVKALFAHGDAPVALLLFFASICVPFLKMVLLTWLLLSVQCRWMWRPRDRTVIYRLVHVIGRWSMLDIFVISILVALVDLGSIATIEAGAGAVSFCAVVILTMFAAETFDPRLIWDVLEDKA